MSTEKNGGGADAFGEEDQGETVTAVSERPAIRHLLDADAFQKRDRATLIAISGASAGAIFTLLEHETVMGRSRSCTVSIDGPGMSRRHARVVRSSNGDPSIAYVLEDLGSSNGTFVNGERVTSRPLSHGDRVRLGAEIELRFAFTDEEEERLLRHLYESNVLDALTGAYNRKHFSERLASEIAFAKRHRAELSLLVVDLDHFDSLNATHGHAGGDCVLRAVATTIKRALRVEDVFARFDGEEFAIIARGIDRERACSFAERIRKTIELADIQFEELPVSITVSIGVASLACCGESAGTDALLQKAQERVSIAKRRGRNRVSIGS